MAVSRAFGDRSLKDNPLRNFEDQRVTSWCEMKHVCCKKGDWLVLFCDGLVEYWDNTILMKHMKKYVACYADPVYSLGFLFDDVIESGSRDNMSCILVQFQGIYLFFFIANKQTKKQTKEIQT